MIQQIETNTGPAFSTEARGVTYHAQQIAGRWCVLSCRNSSKAAGFGSARWFDDLAGVESIKAFSGLTALVTL
jgi:hypothetical protein